MTDSNMSGTCGEGITFSFDPLTNKLSFEGHGSIPNYKKNQTPWVQFSAITKTIEINEGITEIGAYAFFYFQSLVEITLSSSVSKIGKYAFYKCQSIDTRQCKWDGVKIVGDSAFMWCNSPNFLSVPPNIEVIGTLGFACIKKIKTLVLPNSIKQLGVFSFGGCDSITNFEMPNTIELIKGGFLQGAHNLSIKSIKINIVDKKYTCPYKLDYKNKIMYRDNKLIAFFYDKSFNGFNYKIPEYISEICPAAFYRAYGIVNIFIHDNIQSIGFKAFGNMRKLKTITLPKNLKKIDKGILYCEKKGISNLKTVIINCDINNVDKEMFNNAYNLNNLIFNGHVNNFEEGSLAQLGELKCLLIKYPGATIHQHSFKHIIKNKNKQIIEGTLPSGLYICDDKSVLQMISEIII